MSKLNSADYAAPLELTPGQGDPLGLASTNERLYNTVFPGFNNTVRYARVYSSLCWMALRAQEHLEHARGLTDSEANQVRVQALEKMELALLWASGPEAELAGKTRPFGEGGSRQRLAMNEWDMNVRLLSAQQYLPSITNGFKFLDDQMICTDRGHALAQAFEERLGGLTSHRWLRDVQCLEVTKAQMDRTRPALSVLERPSVNERRAFEASFFPLDPTRTGEIIDARDEFRWRSLHLVLHTIEQLNEGGDTIDEQSIRSAMASGVTPSGRSVLRPGLEKCQALWAILQVRILQRMALETLLAIAIAWVKAHDRIGRSIADCAGGVSNAVERSFASVDIFSLRDMREQFSLAQGERHTLAEAASLTGDEAPNIYFYMKELSALRVTTWFDALASPLRFAVTGLVACAVETSNFLQSADHTAALRSTPVERTSLTALNASLMRFLEEPISAWARELIQVWVFSRYDEVASQRALARPGRLRFDFIEGEYGLELGPARNKPLQAAWQNDKLATALILLQQCALVSNPSSGWQLTRSGRRRVAGYREALAVG